jgi:hypothetical protein
MDKHLKPENYPLKAQKLQFSGYCHRQPQISIPAKRSRLARRKSGLQQKVFENFERMKKPQTQ